MGFIELLQNPDLSLEQHNRFNTIIRKSSNRLLTTINDIVEISKIESGQVLINYEKTNINELLHYLLIFFKPEAEAKSITLECEDVLPDNLSVISTDRNKLESILINLIKNAIKFTQKGSIKFGCRYREKIVEFYVKDTGIGIPKERCKAIFERFVQAETSLTRSHEGSGLGLAISKAYAEMLGGDIWVESKTGIGTSFYFNISVVF